MPWAWPFRYKLFSKRPCSPTRRCTFNNIILSSSPPFTTYRNRNSHQDPDAINGGRLCDRAPALKHAFRSGETEFRRTPVPVDMSGLEQATFTYGRGPTRSGLLWVFDKRKSLGSCGTLGLEPFHFCGARKRERERGGIIDEAVGPSVE